MAKKLAPVITETTVEAAVADTFSVIQELGEEMREAYDNTPESLQNSGAGEARGEAADTLEGISEPDMPDIEAVKELKVTFTAMPLKTSASRAARLEHGLLSAQAAISALEKAKDELSRTEEDDKEYDEEGHELDWVDGNKLSARLVELFDGVDAPTSVRVEDDRGGRDAFMLVIIRENDGPKEDDTSMGDAIDALVEEIQQMIDEAEGVTFPGMFG